MTKRALAALITAVVVVGFAAAVIASTVGGSDKPSVHTMSGGKPMTGTMTTPTHQMGNGETMTGEQMNP